MATKRRRLYWDSLCFIALFNRERTTDPRYLGALISTYGDMLDGKLYIITSDLFRAEVFGNRLTGDAERVYVDLLGCPFFELFEIRTRAWEVAGQLRQRQPPGQSLRTPDALHVAMAFLVGADEMWTIDKQLVNKSKAGLLLSTPVRYPYAEQLRLGY